MNIPAAPLPFPIATKARIDFFLPSFAFIVNTFFSWRKKKHKASCYGTVQLGFLVLVFFKECQFTKKEWEICAETLEDTLFVNGYRLQWYTGFKALNTQRLLKIYTQTQKKLPQ